MVAGPVWRLTDWGPRLPGVEVRCTTPTLEAHALAPELAAALAAGGDALWPVVARMAAAFADSLLSWTLTTPSGAPAPPTRRGVLRVDRDVLLLVLREWFRCWDSAGHADRDAAEDAAVAALADVPMVPLVPEADEAPGPQLEAVS